VGGASDVWQEERRGTVGGVRPKQARSSSGSFDRYHGAVVFFPGGPDGPVSGAGCSPPTLRRSKTQRKRSAIWGGGGQQLNNGQPA
jgi:hypothetical protein